MQVQSVASFNWGAFTLKFQQVKERASLHESGVQLLESKKVSFVEVQYWNNNASLEGVTAKYLLHTHCEIKKKVQHENFVPSF